MHHPGPPRFTSVGESVELAPTDPDAAAASAFRWSLLEAPEGSDVTIGSEPVEHLSPDRPGVYRLELAAPDGSHQLTVRAFPDERQPVRFEAEADALPALTSVSVTGPFNDHRLGVDEPVESDGVLAFETALEPGEYEAVFVPDGDFRDGVPVTRTVAGPDRPRVRLDASFADGHVRFEATPLAAPGGEEVDEDLDVEFYVDDRDQPGFDGELAVDGWTATCDRAQLPDQLRVHAVAVGERYSVPDAVSVGRDGAVERLDDPPEWVADATIYSVFTRAFTGEADASFREIERRVPYLEWLGVDALWLTPIVHAYSPQRDHDGFEYGGPHGYDTLDYFQTAPDLGTIEEFDSLVETCHDHGVKVLFDLVINHTSRRHPFFQLAAAGVEDYREYYEWTDDGEPVTYFSWSSIPNLDYDSLAVREHLLDVVDFWARRVDGFRCDVAWGVPLDFWQEVRERVKARDPEFLMLDESLPRDPFAHELAFDLHYDTTLYHRLREIGRGSAPASALLDAVESEAREGFPTHAIQMRYVENHDETRYLEACDRDAQQAATAATFTLPGTPLLYYGQETGMTSFRGAMEWGGDEALTTFVRQLVRRRAELPVLRHGAVEPIDYGSDTEAAVAFARVHEGRRVVVVLNFGSETADVTLPEAVESVDLLSGQSVPVEVDGEATTVPVETAVVFETA